MHGRTVIFGLIGLAFLAGCSGTDAPTETPSPAPIASTFDLAKTGTITGRVEWHGDVPTLANAVMTANAYHNCLYKKPVTCVPPHQPRVKNGGVGGAVVFLRGVDPRQARPWDHAAVRVEFRDRRMIVKQGDVACEAAFVHAGAAIETVNLDEDYHALRGRGVEFFGLPLVHPHQVSRRVLSKIGLVELTSGAGYYWQRAHLFVSDHPYFAHTDAEGRFSLEQVPAGKYEVVSWLPSWIVTAKEIDPETAVIARLQWAPPQEQRHSIEVKAGATATIDFRWSRAMFE